MLDIYRLAIKFHLVIYIQLASRISFGGHSWCRAYPLAHTIGVPIGNQVMHAEQRPGYFDSMFSYQIRGGAFGAALASSRSSPVTRGIAACGVGAR